MGIIYISENKIDGKKYVGKTTRTLEERFREHLEESYYPFGKALRKYGLENFQTTQIMIDDESLNDKERELIKELNTIAPNGYNLTAGGDGVTGHSQETIEKMKKAKFGTKQTEETRAKRSLSMMGKNKGKKPWLGRHQTAESIEKTRAANLGRKASDETRLKQRNAKLGTHQSKETIEKRFRNMKGQNHPMFGKHQSPESIERTRLAKIGKKQSKETIEKRSASLKIAMKKWWAERRAKEAQTCSTL